MAQLVERVLGKDEVMGSSPISSFLIIVKCGSQEVCASCVRGVTPVFTSLIVLLVLLFGPSSVGLEKGVLKRDG